MITKHPLILLALFSVVLNFGNHSVAQNSSTLVELFEYPLPLVHQFPKTDPPEYTICTVASLIYEGTRYYRTVLSKPGNPIPLLVSANVGRGRFTPNSFAYSDEVPAVIDGKVVYLTHSTTYVLDPETLKVITSELRQTDPAGNVVKHYICSSDGPATH